MKQKMKGHGHEWRTNPVSRTSDKTNCPFCTLTPQSKQELIITFELIKLFKNIDPKGLKTKLEGGLRAIDIFYQNLIYVQNLTVLIGTRDKKKLIRLNLKCYLMRVSK